MDKSRKLVALESQKIGHGIAHNGGEEKTFKTTTASIERKLYRKTKCAATSKKVKRIER